MAISALLRYAISAAAEEVAALVDRFLKALGPNESPISELSRLKQLLLARDAKEPEDQVARAFASAQLGYAPRISRSIASMITALHWLAQNHSIVMKNWMFRLD